MEIKFALARNRNIEITPVLTILVVIQSQARELKNLIVPHVVLLSPVKMGVAKLTKAKKIKSPFKKLNLL